MTDHPKIKAPWEVSSEDILRRLRDHCSHNPVAKAVVDCCRHTGARMTEDDPEDLPGVLAWMVEELVDQVKHLESRLDDLYTRRVQPCQLNLEKLDVSSLSLGRDDSGDLIDPGDKVPDDED